MSEVCWDLTKKSNLLGVALVEGMTLKVYSKVKKGLKLKARKFWKKYTGKTVRVFFCTRIPPSLILNRVNHQFLHHFCNFSIQVTEQAISNLKARFTVASKAWLETFYETVSKTLPAGKLGKDYDSLSYLFFEFEEALTSFRFEYFDQIVKLNYVNNVAKNLLPVNFTKVVPSKILADGNCL